MKLVILFLLVASAVAELPSYFHPCSRADPSIGKCFVKQANAVFSKLTKGDDTLQFPSLDPVLRHPGAIHDPNDEFYFELKDTDVKGLHTIKLSDAKVDFEKKAIWFQYKFSKVEWFGTYVAKAKKANDEVSDKAHLIYYDNEYYANLSYDVKDGHMVLKTFETDFTKQPKIDFHLDNLDKHEAVNALWEKEKGGFVKEGTIALEKFMTVAFTNVFKVATYDEIFPPKA